MDRQPLEVQTLYAELIERLAMLEAQRTIGHVPGGFVTKSIKGQEYYYFQHMGPGGTKHQTYMGRRDEVLDAVARRYVQGREGVAGDAESIRRLCSLLRAGGVLTTDAPSARVMSALADVGVFHLGGVLVGTHAFTVIGNLLGVKWRGLALHTQDVDVAAASRLSVAVPHIGADVPGALESLEMGFLPVPGFDPGSPSTSYKVRGQGLRVDMLTPARTSGLGSVAVPRFKTAAQPLRYLDFVMDGSIRGVVVSGGAVLVNVPDPARFAIHKLIVAGERPVGMHVKREKDLRQAAQVLGALLEDRPGDVERAWKAAESRGRGWERRMTDGVTAMANLEPDAAAGLRALLGTLPSRAL